MDRNISLRIRPLNGPISVQYRRKRLLLAVSRQRTLVSVASKVTHIAALGEDAGRREKRVRRIFSKVLPVMGHFDHLLVARHPDNTILGVLGTAAPGRCQPTAKQRMQLTLGLLPLGPRALTRSLRWVGTWEKRDPDERHWHLGPVAVDAHLQGMGIGSKLLLVFCAQMDAAGEDAYLEPDKPENVRFYERFGFEVVGEEEVIGVPNWYMARQPQGTRG